MAWIKRGIRGTHNNGTALAPGGFSQNLNGLNNVGGTLRSMGNNIVDLNGTNTAGTISVLGGL